MARDYNYLVECLQCGDELSLDKKERVQCGCPNKTYGDNTGEKFIYGGNNLEDVRMYRSQKG